MIYSEDYLPDEIAMRDLMHQLPYLQNLIENDTVKASFFKRRLINNYASVRNHLALNKTERKRIGVAHLNPKSIFFKHPEWY